MLVKHNDSQYVHLFVWVKKLEKKKKKKKKLEKKK